MRQNHQWTKVLLAGAAVAAFFGTFAFAQDEATLEEAEPCVAIIAPDALEAQDEPAVVEVRFTQALGVLGTVHSAEESGVRVVQVSEEESAEALTLSLDTSGAQEGNWTLSFEGDMAVCQGTLRIDSAA